ncbi:MAG: hypothetical protein Q8M94_22190 [Ignavibacteria bacterium]|nr:hypothetical protein [Ignavibacteria bacterium]
MVKFYAIIVLLFFLHVSVKPQSEENVSDRFYLGFRTGLSARMVNESNYIFNLGGSTFYNWENNFISASFNRGYTFYFEMNRDNSKYYRYEICYGKVLRLHETHPVFKYLYFTYTVGLSYNIFNFFEDQNALSKNIAKKIEMVGLPIGLAFTNRIGKSLFGGVELKFHVFQKINTHGELSSFIMVNIF